jgi:hypothetical protein
MDHKQFLSSWCSDFLEDFAINVWKIAPFRAGNRGWILVIFKAYVACLCMCMGLACIINSIEGKKWLHEDVNGKSWSRARGDFALDECIWYVVTTVHGIGFNEFNAHGKAARYVTCLCVSLGYWFVIFLLAAVLLSQLPGERTPSLYSVTARVVNAVWPSYSVFVLFTVVAGSTLGPYVSEDQFDSNGMDTGVYFAWTVAHRMVYGDIYPDTPYGRGMTIVLAVTGLLYMPYALALVAVRAPTLGEHENLLGLLRKNPDSALGRGYIVPPEAGGSMREVVMQEYSPEPVC